MLSGTIIQNKCKKIWRINLFDITLRCNQNLVVMTKEYKTKVELKGHLYYGPYLDGHREDFTGDVILTIWAKDEAEAKSVAETYDYRFSGEWTMECIDEVNVLCVAPTGRYEEDDDVAEVMDEVYGGCTSDRAYYYAY